MTNVSSASSVTAADLEAQPAHSVNKVSYFQQFTDQAGVTDAVLKHEYPGQGTEKSPYLVDFLPEDSYNPMTFAHGRKWMITIVHAWATLALAFASSAYSGGFTSLRHDFPHASQEIIILGVSMFVVGFALGPLLWAPASEIVGRQVIFFISYLALTAFNAGAAGAPSIGALIVLRFFAGAFGSSALTNAGGVIADMFDASERGIATSIFAMAPFLGPAIGPIAGGFLGQSAGWRWVEGLTAAFTGLFWIISTVTYPETYVPVLLRKRAIELSKRTGKVYIARIDADQPKQSVRHQFSIALSRPWILLFKEPIVFLISIYMAIIYGTLYMCFAAFPIVFGLGRHWTPGVSGLAFSGIAVGFVAGTAMSIYDNKRYIRVASKYPAGMAPPEARLPPAILGSIFLPIGLFWFAWTNGPQIHWIVPIIGSAFFSCGIVLVFLASFVYLVDSYVIFAASVLAANSVLRSLFGAAFPLFTTQMYDALGIHWASSIPAFLALACLPFPFLFWKYGDKIRARCEYAAEAAAVLERFRNQNVKLTEDEAMDEAAEKEHQKHRHQPAQQEQMLSPMKTNDESSRQ